MTMAVFPGTLFERFALNVAIARYCSCERDADTGAISKTCGPHAMLLEQRALNGLVMMRRQRKRLEAQELAPYTPVPRRPRG